MWDTFGCGAGYGGRFFGISTSVVNDALGRLPRGASAQLRRRRITVDRGNARVPSPWCSRQAGARSGLTAASNPWTCFRTMSDQKPMGASGVTGWQHHATTTDSLVEQGPGVAAP